MLQTSIALILFLFPLAYSPGPGNMFFAANGARFGFKATIPALAGYHIATLAVTVVIGIGFGAVHSAAPVFFVGMKYAGACYVAWLAWKLFRAAATESHERARPASFIDGGVLLLLNPKAYVIISLMFTQFLNVSHLEQSTEIGLISAIFTLNNLIAFVLWAIIGDQIARLFRSDIYSAYLNKSFGILLGVVAAWMCVA